jgi:hypothetical protein
MSDREALTTWQMALKLVKAKGVPHENRDGVEILIHNIDQVTIAFTPAKDERPNGLDIWRHGDADRKVLDVIWTDGTMPVIVTYWGGAWEQLLKRTLV